MRVSPLLALIMILFCAGCTAPRVAPEHWVNVTDDTGHTVRVPVPVRQVVSLSPSETEILGALGRTDLLTGRSDACNWPPEVLRVPAVGGSQTFRVEAVAALRPDLILATPHVDPQRLDDLRTRGFPVLVFAPETVEEIYRNIRVMGEALGEQRNATRLVEDLRAQEQQVRSRSSGHPRVRAAYVFWDNPLYIAGNETYENSLISGAGGINVYIDSTGYVMSSEEVLTRRLPEVIIVPGGPSVGNTNLTAGLLARPAFANLPAIRNNRICTVDADIAHRPGPRVVQGMELFWECLHG
jgi:iron complex transport system substrate-binding protein